MGNSVMFWRIVRRLLTANFGRLFLILLALGAGAAVTSALLNLQIDAKRRLTTEFRASGANVIVVPVISAKLDGDSDGEASSAAPATLAEAFLSKIPAEHDGRGRSFRRDSST